MKNNNYNVTLSLVDYDEKCVPTLLSWRKKAGKYFNDQFTPTHKSTATWLYNLSKDPKRKLFWVVVDGKKIGHMGYVEREGLLEIDCVIRGNMTHKGAMGEAMRKLLHLMRKIRDDIYVRVYKSNPHAIKWYVKHGFVYAGEVENDHLLYRIA